MLLEAQLETQTDNQVLSEEMEQVHNQSNLLITGLYVLAGHNKQIFYCSKNWRNDKTATFCCFLLFYCVSS